MHENDLKTEGENHKVLEKRAVVNGVTEGRSPTDLVRRDKPLQAQTERGLPAEAVSEVSSQGAPSVLPLKTTGVRSQTGQVIDLERRDERAPAQGVSEVIRAGREERSPCYSLHRVTGPDSLASLIAQRRDSQPSLGSSSKES